MKKDTNIVYNVCIQNTNIEERYGANILKMLTVIYFGGNEEGVWLIIFSPLYVPIIKKKKFSKEKNGHRYSVILIKPQVMAQDTKLNMFRKNVLAQFRKHYLI